ncbi:hypothetical protein Gohar_009964, partial [Gossypium harknessii]|nr:hypothetical protein [Gossypium harknessii]
SVLVDCDNEEVEEIRTKASSSGTSKRKRKNTQESVVNEQIKFVGDQLGKIANALEQFTVEWRWKDFMTTYYVVYLIIF